MRKGNTRSRDSEFEQKVVEISRVTRVVAGGKRMRFRALVVIGDKKGRVGMSLKKGADVSEAVKKASGDAKKELISVPMVRGTIPHQIKAKYKASVVMLKPALLEPELSPVAQSDRLLRLREFPILYVK